MLNGLRIVVVMPAYNAARTLHKTYDDLPHDIVDHVVLVDDASQDSTAKVAQELGLDVIVHDRNKGYGGNQKTCYDRARALDADIVVMLHPDYQYTPKLVRAMTSVIAEGVYDVVLGSRILGNGARRGGMPLYKYISNRWLTFVENLMLGQKLSEYHTGYRAFSRAVLDTVRYEDNSDDFVFDNQFLVQCHANHFGIAEITCPTSYFAEASSINFRRSVRYGFGCLWTGTQFLMHRLGLAEIQMMLPKAPPTPRALPALKRVD